MRPLDLLNKIPQWEGIAYAPDLSCPECYFAGFASFQTPPNLIGWCETNRGYMGVFECPECFTKFRFHTSSDKWDLDEFEKSLQKYAGLCGNKEELKSFQEC